MLLVSVSGQKKKNKVGILKDIQVLNFDLSYVLAT